MWKIVNSIVGRFLRRFIDYLPNFFGGLLIFSIGVLLANLVKKILLSLIGFSKIEHVLQKTGLISKDEIKIWKEVLVEILRWGIIILFLVPTLEVWGLSRATVVLNQVLFYIPNAIVAVIIGFIGLLASNLVADLVNHSLKALGASAANSLSIFAKATIIFFTVLIVLNQLGVAQDLIRILFTGIVAMVAIAGGLAFGLGGQGIAKDLLESLRKKLK